MFYEEYAAPMRSVRDYTGEKLSGEELELLAKTALSAPSSANRKPVDVLVVTEEKEISTLKDLKPHGASFLPKAPAVFVMMSNQERSPKSHIQDAALAADYLRLQAYSMGLGSCWVNCIGSATENGKSSSDYVRELFEIPENFFVSCVIAVGHPAEEPAAKPFEYREKLHWDKF